MKVYEVSGDNNKNDKAPEKMPPVQFAKIEDAINLIKAGCRAGYKVYVTYVEEKPFIKIIDLD